jgi:hypothetical protein
MSPSCLKSDYCYNKEIPIKRVSVNENNLFVYMNAGDNGNM